MEQRDDLADGTVGLDEHPALYRVYVMRLWSSGTGAAREGSVRCSLEDPTTRTRRGFADLDSLVRFVRENLNSPQEAQDGGRRPRAKDCAKPAPFGEPDCWERPRPDLGSEGEEGN